MDLSGGIFVLLVAILVVISILLGFVIRNFINLPTRDVGSRGERTSNETQLDRIEDKLDRSNNFSRGTFVYMLGLTAIVAGFALIASESALKESWVALLTGNLSIFAKGGWAAIALGITLSIIGLVFRFRTSRSSKK